MPRISTALAVACLALAAYAPAAGACSSTGRTPTPQTLEVSRQAVICLIKQRRHHHHLRRLNPDAALEQASQGHSDAMAASNFFGHDGSDGTPESRANGAGYVQGARRWGIGEVLGFGTRRLGTPKSIVNAWMRSGVHRDVILSKRWRQLGVGVTIGSPLGPDRTGMATYTVDFGYRHG